MLLMIELLVLNNYFCEICTRCIIYIEKSPRAGGSAPRPLAFGDWAPVA